MANLTKEELDKLVADANGRMDAADAEEATEAVQAETDLDQCERLRATRECCGGHSPGLGCTCECHTPAKPAAEPQQELVPDRKRDLLGVLVRHLINHREDVKLTFAVMLFSRQLYAVGMKDLEYKLEGFSEKEKQRLYNQALKAEEVAPEEGDPTAAEVFELIEEALVQTCRHAAAQAFTEEQLIPAFTKVVQPWFEKTLVAHIKKEQAAKQAHWDELEKLRKARPVPLGVGYDPDLQDKLAREQPLVLVGWAPAVHWLMAKIAEHARTAGDEQVYQVCRLMTQLKPNVDGPDAKPKNRLVRLGAKDWEDVTKARAGLDKLFVGKVLPQLSEPLDLLLVDDAAHAAKSQGLSLASKVLTAAAIVRKVTHANKIFREFGHKAGCAVVLGAPLPDRQLPDFTDGSWEQLNTFAYLRAVKVVEKGDDYIVSVGVDAWETVVPKAEIDGCQTSTIILAR